MTEIREFATWGVDEPLRVRKWVPLEDHETEIAARDQTIKDLGFQLGMAEEGLANYAQENAHLHSTLTYRLRDLDDARAELHRIRNQSLRTHQRQLTGTCKLFGMPRNRNTGALRLVVIT